MRHVIPGAILSLLLRTAHAAAPPPHGDPTLAPSTLAPWYNSLQMPGSTVLCCAMSDCRPVLSRIVDGHYQAFIADQWRDVPDDRVLTRLDNPTGHAVACWTPFAGVICFIKAPES